MNLITRLAVLCAALFLTLPAQANKFYSKMTVTAEPTGGGKVYVSSTSGASPVYESTCSASNNTSSNTATSASHTYYLFAKAEPGYQFKNWTLDGVQKSTNENYTASIAVTKDQSSESKAATATYVANFVERTTMIVAEATLGTVTVSPKENKLGSEVTVTFKPQTFGVGSPNLALIFEGCYDSDGNLVSTEESFKITAEKMTDLTGSYRWEPALTKNKGYYRVFNCYNAPLRLSGSYPINIGASSTAVSIHPDITSIKTPLGYSIGENSNVNRNFYDDPAAVIYLEGTLNTSISQNQKEGDKVLENVQLAAQGMYASEILNGYSATASIQWSPALGQYKLVSSIVSLKTLWDSNINGYNDCVKLGKDATGETDSSLSLHPITEEYADRFWFGACPVEEMYHDGGYWTSMYASFPFMCYEPDGVEAYIISDCKNNGTENLLVLSRIENGIVPAATPVLLKCRNWTDTYDYFNNKKPIAPQNRLIPLLPDDERIDPNVAAGNLLRGTYNLLNGTVSKDWSDVESRVPDKYDDSRHRIFSVNAAGQVGFYRQPAGHSYWIENQTTPVTEMGLQPNRAYLDMSVLPSATLQGAPFRIISENEAAGIENIVIDESPAARQGIFDLYGRPVQEPVPGNIYIVNGVKTLAR